MNWIPVSRRVPNSRRKVLVWVKKEYIKFLVLEDIAISKFNAAKEGGLFDIEYNGLFSQKVTHWAEIESPKNNNGNPPKGGSGVSRK